MYPLNYNIQVEMQEYVEMMADGGTGQKLTYATTVVAGIASVVATILSVMYGLVASPMMMHIANLSL
ncbi:hypothetical protein LB503_010876 [Fusarium chuoi]|nr:hypothetical protein LB503_010876 [Fusarium chuoi]